MWKITHENSNKVTIYSHELEHYRESPGVIEKRVILKNTKTQQINNYTMGRATK